MTGRDLLLIAACITAVGYAAFYFGQHLGAQSERELASLRAKAAVEKQMRKQKENEIDVLKMGDVARCAAHGGRLSAQGVCR